jgi:ABC transporter substrate binding protein (PQQ-dependent alcohol dehydrogenase system)
MNFSVGRLRCGPLRVAFFAALGLLASALLEPAFAGAPETAPAAPPPTAAEPPAAPPDAAGPPASAETPPPPAAAGTGSPAAPAATAPAFEMPIKATVPIVYLGKQYEEPLPLSYAEKPIFDKGIQGARLIAKEANQAGRFVGYAFDLVEAIVPANADVVAKAKEILAKGDAFIIADLEPKDLLAVADLPEAKNSILVNIRSNEEALRQENCRPNVFHILPDWAMRADALAQYLIWKKWPRWFIVRGDTPADKEYVEQIKRAAKRFGGKIVAEKVYDLPPGARNTDSGYQQVQAQIPMVTQSAPEHDVVWVANTDEGFGDYIAYRTYLPRPVVGTQGLQALAWDSSYTEYGAMHFQNGLPKLAKRRPVERDYTAWLGGRSLTDGIMRSGETAPAKVKEYLLSDKFKLEGFKGQAMSFRTWDHQLRQPVILGGGTRVPVSVSPQEGFLHPTNVTDTLGFDQPETKCKLP